MGSTEHDKAPLKEALLDAARLDLGEGVDEPDAFELQAYLAGELTEEQDEHVRAWLVATEGAGDRLLELASFVEAKPPADDVPASLEEEKSWRAFQRRLADNDSVSESDAPPTAPEPLRASEAPRGDFALRSWQAIAAVLALSTGLLLLRVFNFDAERNPQNLRKLALIGDARGGAVDHFSMVPDEPFLVEISPTAAPAGCDSYGVELRELDGAVLSSVEDLKLTDRILRFVLSAQPGPRLLEVSACGQPLDRFRVDLVVD